MKNTIRIRLDKTDDGEYCFKYGKDNIARTPYGLVTLIQQGVNQREMSKGTKVSDKEYTRYIFDYHSADNFKFAQEPAKIVIRMKNEYLKDIYDVERDLDTLCLQTKYIKSKNMIKILAISLTGVVFLSIAGAKIVDRIRDPKHYDFGRNGEYSSHEENIQNEEEKSDLEKIYEEVHSSLHM